MITADAMPQEDRRFEGLIGAVSKNFAERARGQKALFRTDASGLFELYLSSLGHLAAEHNCRSCRRFVENYGGLVELSTGPARSVMWNENSVPEPYRAAFRAMRMTVEGSRVTAPFFTRERTWGIPRTGPWPHLSVTCPDELLHKDKKVEPHEAEAGKLENLRLVKEAMERWPDAVFATAERLVAGESLTSSSQYLGPVKWYRRLRGINTRTRAGQAELMREVTLAPNGFCHPGSGVLGTLLNDIKAGVSFETLKRRFAKKLDPLTHGRAQTAPAAGTIRAAEKIFEKMGLASALERRYARLEEVTDRIWEPAPQKRPDGKGLFGHIPSRSAPPAGHENVRTPLQEMTFSKLARQILPYAESIRLHVPRHSTFMALTTAVHADAEPIFKWDREGSRNPLSWYTYPKGTPAQNWGLRPGDWAEVTAIVPMPSGMLPNPMPFFRPGAVVLLAGARDHNANVGAALFPTLLRDELHEVRSVIEAYSNDATLGGREEASACGVSISGDPTTFTPQVLEIVSRGVTSTYRVDRWD